MTGRSRLIVVLALVLLAVGGAVVATTLTRNRGPQVAASSTGSIGGPFTLVAADGKTVTDQTYRGKWLLIYFGYTFCPDACPQHSTIWALRSRSLGGGRQNSASVYHRRSQARYCGGDRRFLKSFDPGIVGLTAAKNKRTASRRGTGSMSRRKLKGTTISSTTAPTSTSWTGKGNS